MADEINHLDYCPEGDDSQSRRPSVEELKQFNTVLLDLTCYFIDKYVPTGVVELKTSQLEGKHQVMLLSFDFDGDAGTLKVTATKPVTKLEVPDDK